MRTYIVEVHVLLHVILDNQVWAKILT